MRRHRLILCATLIGALFPSWASAAACASAASGNWSLASTWAAPCNVAGGPVAGDDVSIGAAHIVTLTAPAAAATLTIANPTAANGVTLNGNTLTLSGALTMTRPTNSAASTVGVGSGALTAASITINGGSNANRVAQVTVSSGTVTVSGSIIFANTAAQARFISTGDSKVYVGGDFRSGGTLTTGGSGTITFNGGAAQSVGAYGSYNNVVIAKSGGIATLAGNSTVGGALTVSGGSFDMGTNTLAIAGALSVSSGTMNINDTLTVTGTTSVAGTLNINATTGTKTFSGLVSVGPGGVWNNSANEAVSFQGGLSFGGANFIAGSGVHSFNTNNQEISGTLSIPSITVTGVTLSNNGNLTLSTALAGTGGLTNAAGSQLHLGFSGAVGITTLTASASGNLVEYSAAGNQSIKTPAASTYQQLSLSGSGSKTAGAALTINGDLTLSGSASFNGSGAFTHSCQGNWIVNSSAAAPLALTGSTIDFNAPATPAATAIGGTTAATLAFNSVNINNSSGVNLNNNASFAGALNVASTLTPAPAVLISGAGTLTGNGTVQVTRTAATAGFDNQYSIATKTLANLTVEYLAASAQIVSARSYGGLKINNPAGATLAGAVTVGSTLTLSSGTLSVGANLLSLNGPAIAGTATNLNTSSVSSLSFGGASSDVALPSSVSTLNNLTVNNANGLSAGGAPTLTVGGTLTLTAGAVAMGSSTLAATANCPASISRTNGYVSGKLQLRFPANASTTCNYAIGSGSSYTPIGITLVAAAGGGGTLTASTTGTEHGQVAASGLDANRDANRYWSLWTSGDTISASSYGLTFNFVGSDVDGDATPANFVVAMLASGAWTLPVPVTATATATSVSNLSVPLSSSTGSIDFLVGEAYSLCFNDDFSRADGAPGNSWSVGRKGGGYTPAIVGGRLRLTDASNAAGTWAALQRVFPAAGNRVTAEFDHYAYGGSGADGIAVILSNAAVAPSAGAFGGSLGYAQKSNPGSDCTQPGGCPGFTGGWLGVAIDEYGNFSASSEGRYGGAPAPIPSSVAMRGSGSGMSGYRYLTGTATLDPPIDNNGSAVPPHRYRVIVDNRDGTHAWVSVERNSGAGYAALLGDNNCAATLSPSCIDARDIGYGQDVVPNNWNFSFTGASGALTNFHEIDSVRICTTLGQVTPGLNHLRLEHGGQACTGAASPASVTIKACADASCSSLYLGSVTADLSNIAGATWSSDPVTFSGGQILLTLSDATPGSVTLGATATAPAASGATRCFNGATESCSLNFGACSFDVIEVGAAAYSPIYTKLAGAAFNLDLLSLAGRALTVNRAEIVDAGSGTCSSYASIQDSSSTVPSSFTANQRKAFTFASAGALRNARVRVAYSCATTPYNCSNCSCSCSSDNFAVRPTSFTVTSNAVQTGSSGTPAFRAGSDSFRLTATALTGYDGTPKLNAALVAGLNAHGTLSTPGFPAAAKASGIAYVDGNTFSEVGNYSLAANAVYDDGFAYVDSRKLQPECTSDFSNAAVGGKFGCMFGSAASGPFGRFIPDHFTAVASVADACSAGAAPFTYMDQGFSVLRSGSVSAQLVEARNGADVLTQNYAGSYAHAGISLAAENADSGVDLGASLRYFGGGAIGGSWSGGIFSLGASSLAYVRPGAPAGANWGPFDGLDIGIAVSANEGDIGATTAPALGGLDMNPTVHGGGSFTHKKLGTLRMRYGRLVLGNAYGSELLPMRLPVVAQYVSGTASGTPIFASNTLDSCTAVVANSLAIGCGAGISGSRCLSPLPAASGGGTLAAGGGYFLLAAPGNGHQGAVDVALNLGGSTSDNSCIDWSPPPASSAGNLPWLQYAWCAGKSDPGARANFGAPKTPFIYLRERY